MNNNIPQVKTVKLLFVAMDERQQAMFKMAFKMHSTTSYQVIGADGSERPEMVIVDGDGPMGAAVWQKAKTDYPKSVVVFFSKRPPMITAPYLPKPIKFDTLFLSLRNLLQGNGVWVGNLANGGQQQGASGGFTAAGQQIQQQAAPAKPAHPERAAEMRIPRFDPRRGLLGRFRELLNQSKDTVIVFNEKPVLAVFPSIQRVWVPDSKLLETLCRQEQPDIRVKIISEGSQIQERANATVVSCMWQVAVWTANGRLVYPLTPSTVCRLKQWPNLTRLAPLPESMRLSAFLTKTSVSLNMLYKMMPLDMADILNYIAATYLTDYLAVSQTGAAAADSAAAAAMPKAVRRKAAEPAHKEGRRGHSADDDDTEQPKKEGGLLSRLMKRLLSK
ncbi:alpha-glucan phosphorylase [Conchiformibius steedae]|uniref:alpha-glucan phosphorylase n=1 Tax=Conchiformibius steedae TaxID=153493 RepID=UPI0026F37CF6|nr:alpha-glucan phosphorylase [Conchiformibius steedae]